MAESPKNSILANTKKLLGIEDDYTAFDVDILTHINSVFSTLTQLGIGPESGFRIDDSSVEWSSFISEDKPYLNNVKSYMYLRVRILFDPPTTSFALDAMKEQVKEFEWRLSLYAPPATYSETLEGA